MIRDQTALPTEPVIQITSPGALARPGAILLVSCYELGHQPLGLAQPYASLADEGFNPGTVDLAVEEADETALRAARLVVISVPMHTATRLGYRFLERLRSLGSTAHVTMHGLYARLNAGFLLASGVDSVMGGESDAPLRELARRIHARQDPSLTPIPGLQFVAGMWTEPERRPVSITPRRETLPALRSYAGFERDGVIIAAGYVEASRGCHHTCAHCPITPVYGGQLVVVPRDVVLADIESQISAGARHITFGDPDFFNGPAHSLRVARMMHERWPTVSFDATIKIEHLLEHRRRLPELAELGCAFVVSAVESINLDALAHMKKGHTADDVAEAIALVDDVGVPMRPSLLPFSPWETIESYVNLLSFMATWGMQRNVDPVHYAIRLLIPPRSAVLDDPGRDQWLGELQAETFSWSWTHPDPRMESLSREVSAIAERGARLMEDTAVTFATIWQAAHLAQDSSAPIPPVPAARVERAQPPRLTESWFCCAEPTAEQFDALARGQSASQVTAF